MENEIWKDIKGYEGLYQVSTVGRVASYDRITPSGKFFRGCILKLTPKDGYLRAMLNQKHFRVHRLVANAFIDNPENKPEINHKNTIKIDNRVENLQWSTRSENIQHAYDNGLIKTKLTEEDVRLIRSCYDLGLKNQQELADIFRVNNGYISNLINNNRRIK